VLDALNSQIKRVRSYVRLHCLVLNRKVLRRVGYYVTVDMTYRPRSESTSTWGFQYLVNS